MCVPTPGPRAGALLEKTNALVVAALVFTGLAGALSTRRPKLAVAIVAMVAVVVTPAWILLVGAIATIRGFDTLIPRSGLVGWQTVSLVFIGAAVAKWMLGAHGGGRVPTRTLGLTVAFLAWLLITSVAAGTVLTAPIRLAPWIVLPIFYRENRKSEQWLLQAIVGLALVEMLFSIGEVTTRLRGVHVDDPHQMGFLLIASLAVLLSRSAPFPARPAVIAVLYFGVLATRTRGVWLAGIVVLAVSLLPRLSGRRVVVVILGAVVAGLLLFGPATRMFNLNPASADIRQDTVSAGIEIASQHPAFGIGWTSKDLPNDEFARESGARPYNLFVFLAVVAGIPAALIFILLLFDALQLAARFHFGALLFISAFAAFSVSEATLYPGSLTAPLFFVFFALAADRSRGVRQLSSSLYAEVKRGIRLAPA